MFAKNRQQVFELIDPGKQQEYKLDFGDGTGFSTLGHDCIRLFTADRRYVYDGLYSASLICETLRKTGKKGFLNICPEDKSSYQDLEQFVDFVGFNNSVVGIFDISESHIADILTVMNGYRIYHEWNLASILPGKEPLRGFDHSLVIECNVLLSQFHDLGSLWHFDFDRLQIEIFFRAFNGCDKLIDAILASAD